MDSIEQQILLAADIIARALSVRETEQLVKRSQGAAASAARKELSVSKTTDLANILAAEAKLSRRLGAPVKIRLARTGGVVEVKFSSSEDLARLFDTLMQAQAGPSRG